MRALRSRALRMAAAGVVVGCLVAACDVTAPLRTLDQAPPAWSLSLSPDTLSLAVGDSAQLTAVVRNRRGQPMTDRPVRFSSGDPAVVDVGGTGTIGRVRALRRGVAEVLASVEGLRQRTIVIVD